MKRLATAALILFAALARAQTAAITWGTTYQTIDGFGASDAYRAADISPSVAAFLFGTGSGQLGLTLLRTGIPDGNELPGDCSSVGSSCAALTNTESAALTNGGKVVASTWSPPAAYKTNGATTCTANATLISGDYANYANWLANYALSLQAVGVPLYSVAMQNEPSGCNAIYASAYYSPAQIDTFIKTNLGPTLAGAGLSTLVNMPDESAYYWLPISGGTCGTDSSCMNYVDIVDYHDYQASLSGTNTVTAQPYPSGWIAKHYWVTEAACVGGGGTQPTFCQSGYNTNITDALDWGAVIDQRLAGDNMNAFMYWWLYTPSATDDESLISDSTPYPKRAYLFAQYSRFVRPGYVRIDATRQPQTGVSVSAYRDPGATTAVIVATNYTGSPVSQTFTISGGPAFSSVTPTRTSASESLAALSPVSVSAGSFTYSLPAQSITTFVTSSVPPPGTCPSTVPAGVNACYFVAANGSDSNDGLSEAAGHPWLHAPFMPSCSSNCLTFQNSISGTGAAGLGLILRGGDTWHTGNSGASPYTGGTWEFNDGTKLWSGTSTTPFYIGVDQTWFAGGSWARPKLDGDNPPCNAGTLGGNCHSYSANYWQQFYVDTCAYQTGSSNNQLDVSWISYYYVDNIEFTGSCLQHTGQPFSNDTAVVYNAVHGQHTFANLYIHGWSHKSFAGANGSGACTSGVVCQNQYGFVGTGFTSSIPADKHRNVVIDGSDSDPVAMGAFFASMYDVANSVFRYTSQGLGRQFHVWHNVLYEYYFENGHSNMLESTPEWSGTNVFYNNLLRHLETSGGTNGVGIWLSPAPGNTDYLFDNIVYDEGQMQLFNTGNTETSANSTGTYSYFNNTIDFTAGSGNQIGCAYSGGATGALIVGNGHHITETSAFSGSCASFLTTQTNLAMNHATAAADGYTTSQTYVNSPTSSGSPTVSAGTNRTSTSCATLASAAVGDPSLSDAASACGKDTSYGVTYDSVNHVALSPPRATNVRPSSSAWDIGGYQFSPATTYTVTVTQPANGSITSDGGMDVCSNGTYASGTQLGCLAVASTYYRFNQWTSGPAGCVGTATNPCRALLSGTTTFAASIVPTTVTLTVANPVGGSIINGGNCVTGSYNGGTTSFCSEMTTSGYSFAGWTGMCLSSGTNPTCTPFVLGGLSCASACSVGATFSAASPTFSPTSPYTGAATTVTLSSTTPGATISYCQDTTNTCTPTIVGTSATFTSTGYIRAFANATGVLQSPTVSWQGTFASAPTPTAVISLTLSPGDKVQ